MSDAPRLLERVGDSALRIVWGDGHESLYPWRGLREQCPCAVCNTYDDMGVKREVSIQEIPSAVRATALKLVGRYAVHITWSDGHMTGIYAFDYLRRLCVCEACRPQQFEEG